MSHFADAAHPEQTWLQGLAARGPILYQRADKADRANNMQRLGAKIVGVVGLTLALSGCGGGGVDFSSEMDPETRRELEESGLIAPEDSDSIFDLFSGGDDPNVTVEVNRYLWQASLEILDFMPLEAADPFTGIIVFDYGTPPGGSRPYRATVYVTDPALEARSLRVALQSQSGAVDRQTARQVEDAILSRARQIRIRDGNL